MAKSIKVAAQNLLAVARIPGILGDDYRNGFNTGSLGPKLNDLRAAIEADNLLPSREDMIEALRKADGECKADYLNPCWNNRPKDVIGKHWGGGSACACCHARAILAKMGIK